MGNFTAGQVRPAKKSPQAICSLLDRGPRESAPQLSWGKEEQGSIVKVSHPKGGRLKRSGLCSDVVEEDGSAFLRKSHGPANVPPARPLGRPFRIHPQIENEQPQRGHSFSGGGGWIRTIEGKASRFTVCPLWPLGYSSVCSWAEEGGAGGRIRTPDLLITNQLLYQLSYTSTAASAFTTMVIITAGGGFVNRFSKKK